MENLTSSSSKQAKKLIMNSWDIINQVHSKIKIEEQEENLKEVVIKLNEVEHLVE